LYQELLDSGVAKETARRILPLCSPTTIYQNGTLRSWIHYIDLRTKNGTQLEHVKIAQGVKEIFTQQFPIISEAVWPS
jgi:thymidylate synthase (FAD)